MSNPIPSSSINSIGRFVTRLSVEFAKKGEFCMKTCKRCGRKGFFLHLNAQGLCPNCQSLTYYENQKAKLESEIKELQNTLSDQKKLYEDIKISAQSAGKQELQMLWDQKQIELDLDTQKLADLRTKSSELEKQIEKANRSLNSTITRSTKIKNVYRSMEYALNTYSTMDASEQGFEVPETIAVLDELLEPTVVLKLHSMDIRQLRKLYNQNSKQIEETLAKYQSRYTTKTNAAIYRLMVIALKAELQNVLFSLKYGKLEDAFSNIKLITAKYLKIVTDGNQTIASTLTKFIGEIEYYFLEAIKIEYEYYVKKEQIKEEQRAIREQMRQEAEERKRLLQEREKIEKEESKYHAEMSSLKDQLTKTTDNDKVAALQARIQELQLQIGEVAKKKEDIIRLQNGQAGYVYVISNLGSFGDDVFKIGMTRRFNPQERVDELGSASVPFPFDVHSFIFSKNAVDLENTIHKRLNEKRVNKVNLRKEFFKVTLDELEELVQEFDPTAEFVRTMAAEQYHQSMSIDEPVDSISYDYEDDSDYSEEE